MHLSSDEIFIKQFKNMMNIRSSLFPPFKLSDLPLGDDMFSGTPKRSLAIIRGIDEPFFSRLNNWTVELVGRSTLSKRLALSDGSFRKDDKGNYVVTPVPVPNISVAVISSLSIGLLRKYEDGRIHNVSDGFKYVDYFVSDGNKKYIYIIPRSNVYKLNLSALVVSLTHRRSFYKGCKLALQNGRYVYLYVVPFKYRSYGEEVVVGVKPSINFEKEVSTLLSYWLSIGVTFDLSLTKLDDTLNGVNNVGILDIEGTLSYEDFTPFDVSMEYQSDDDFV